MIQNQGRFQEALQFADSICQQGQCGQVCSRKLFEISLSLDEYEKAEQYFYQWQNAGSGGGHFQNHIMNYGIGYVYSQLGRVEEAKKSSQKKFKDLNHWIGLSEVPIYIFPGYMPSKAIERKL